MLVVRWCWGGGHSWVTWHYQCQHQYPTLVSFPWIGSATDQLTILCIRLNFTELGGWRGWMQCVCTRIVCGVVIVLLGVVVFVAFAQVGV